jgi:tetratricopeptide (TPR) repeat protein/energy-coupling factor transporter ATP-binding protein EcfA2
MLEALGINLLSGAVSSAGSIGVKKTRNILRRDKFSQDIDDLTTEFTKALKQGLSDTVDDSSYEEFQHIEINWTTIAEELDELDTIFEDEQEAVVHVTDAVVSGLDISLEANPELREKLESAVAEAYQTALRDFADHVAGTDLADVFDTEANIELTTTVNTIDDRLAALQQRLHRYETASLRNIGITRLDPLYFERETPNDPELAWRIGFEFADVQAGYPLDRQRPTGDDGNEREAVTEEIINRLDDGENLVILGDGGSGKSTICKQVACQWYGDTERGPIFYRQSSATAAFDQPGDLEAAIRTADGQLLIIVEDAANDDSTAVFDVLNTFNNANDVSFLLDSRKNAWIDTDNLAGAPKFKQQRQSLNTIEVPTLDKRECERAITHFEQVTDATVGESGKQLYEEIRSADIGGPLVLAYELTDPATRANNLQSATALHDDVHRAHIAVKDYAGDTNLPRIVAVMVNILNAAELPVREEFVHALATDRDDHLTIERTLGVLEGRMLELNDLEIGTPHQMWSILYLERVLENNSKRVACEYFEQCVDALFRLCDESERREAVIDWLGTTPEVFKNIEQDKTGMSSHFVNQISSIGDDRANLGSLFGTYNTWSVELPSDCPADAEARWHIARGRTHLSRGALDAAQAEFNRLVDFAEQEKFESESVSEDLRAITLNNLGLLANSRGKLDSAEEYYKESLDISRKIEDHHGQASSLLKLGTVLSRRNKLETAEKHFEESLEIFHEFDDRNGQASSYNNLGLIAQNRGELEAAEEYFEKSFDLHNKIGDRRGQARNLTNLANIAQNRGDLDTAENYNKRSLGIFREVGNLSGEGASLGSLGDIAQERGDLDDTEEYYEESLHIFREIGDRYHQAKILSDLGDVAQKSHNLDNAMNYYDKALDIFDDINAVHEMRHILINLGDVAQERGDLDDAEEYYEESLNIIDEIGDQDDKAYTLSNMGDIEQERDNLDNAEEYYKKSLSIFREAGNSHRKAQNLSNLGYVAQKRGELDAAKEYYVEEIDIHQEKDNWHNEGRCLTNLGDIAQDQDNIDAAKEYYEEAIASFRKIEPCICQSRTLNKLALLEKKRGEVDTAQTHFENSLDIAIDAGNSDIVFFILESLINILEQEDRIEEALKWCDKGIDIADEMGNNAIVEDFQTQRDSLSSD